MIRFELAFLLLIPICATSRAADPPPAPLRIIDALPDDAMNARCRRTDGWIGGEGGLQQRRIERDHRIAEAASLARVSHPVPDGQGQFVERLDELGRAANSAKQTGNRRRE